MGKIWMKWEEMRKAKWNRVTHREKENPATFYGHWVCFFRMERTYQTAVWQFLPSAHASRFCRSIAKINHTSCKVGMIIASELVENLLFTLTGEKRHWFRHIHIQTAPVVARLQCHNHADTAALIGGAILAEHPKKRWRVLFYPREWSQPYHLPWTNRKRDVERGTIWPSTNHARRQSKNVV